MRLVLAGYLQVAVGWNHRNLDGLLLVHPDRLVVWLHRRHVDELLHFVWLQPSQETSRQL